MTATVEESIAWHNDRLRLGLAAAAAGLRYDTEAMDSLLGDRDGIPDRVFELLDGLLFVVEEVTVRERWADHSRERVAEAFDVWISELAGVGPTAKAAAAKAAELAAARVAAFGREPMGCCLHCGYVVALDDDLIRPHRWTLAGPPTVWPRKCPGSGLRPHDVLAPVEHLPYRNGS